MEGNRIEKIKRCKPKQMLKRRKELKLISVTELISHIKPCESENFGLANLKIAINHIAKNGILKEPTTSKRSQQVKGL